MSTQEQNTKLSISWGTSRRSGYRECRLKDEITGKSYKIDGGGFNMIACVLGEWMADVLKDDFSQAIAQKKTLPSFIESDGMVSSSSLAGIEEAIDSMKLIGLDAEIQRKDNGEIKGFVISREPSFKASMEYDTGISM